MIIVLTDLDGGGKKKKKKIKQKRNKNLQVLVILTDIFLASILSVKKEEPQQLYFFFLFFFFLKRGWMGRKCVFPYPGRPSFSFLSTLLIIGFCLKSTHVSTSANCMVCLPLSLSLSLFLNIVSNTETVIIVFAWLVKCKRKL